MSALVLLTAGTKVSLSGEHLLVQPPSANDELDPTPVRMPVIEITHIIATDRVHITMPAVAMLLEHEIPIVIVGGRAHKLMGLCISPPALSTARWLQAKRIEDPAFVRNIASAVVTAKILNQRRVLYRVSANRAELAGPTLDKLQALAAKAERVAPGQIDELRGAEGSAAREYFSMFAAFFPPEAPMQGRTRQPPRDPPNAVLSYGYTLLYGEAICACYAAGLDPVLGFFHEPADNRAALALDIIEPFRAPLADALALDLFSHGQLRADEHFDQTDGGVYLNTEGRKRFHVAYERRMQRLFTDPRTDEQTTLRKALHDDVIAIKMSIVEDRPFAPFRVP